jgi:hypothetical protein
MVADPVAIAAGAILGELVQRAGVAGWRRFVALPPMLCGRYLEDFDVTAAAVAGHPPRELGASPTPEQLELVRLSHAALLAWTANVIVEPGAVVHPDGTSLGDILGPVVRAAAATGPLADRFQTMAARQATAARMLEGVPFWEVAIAPGTDLRDDRAWTAISIPAGMLDTRVNALPPPLAAWVARQDRASAAIRVKEVRCELALIELVRPWLVRDTLVTPGWTWPGMALSDGGDPPQGSMPAYIVGLALIRKAVLVVEDHADPGGAITMAKPGRGAGADGGSAGAGSGGEVRGVVRARVARAGVAAASRTEALRRKDAAASPAPGAAASTAPTSRPAVLGGDTDLPFEWSALEAPGLLERLTADVARAAAALAAAEAAHRAAQDTHARTTDELVALDDKIAAAGAELAELEAAAEAAEPPPALEEHLARRDGGGRGERGLGPRAGRLRALQAARSRLEAQRPGLAAALDAADAAIPPARALVEASRTAHAVAETARLECGNDLTGDNDPEVVYILGYICESLPRCPPVDR